MKDCDMCGLERVPAHVRMCAACEVAKRACERITALAAESDIYARAERNTPRSVADLPDGIHYDVPAEVYHAPALGVISKSALDQVSKSPAHYRAWLAGERTKTSPALAFGSALHAAVLEPEVFAQNYIIKPDLGDGRTKAGKEARAAWEAEHGHKTALSEADAATIAGIRASVDAHPIARRALSGGHAEVTLLWHEDVRLDSGEVVRVRCKARADYYIPGIAVGVDLKSCEDASAAEFVRSVARWRYHVQNAHYAAGFRALGAPIDGFIFVAVEKAPPYAVAVYGLDPEAIERGETLRARELARIAESIKSNEWPAYPAEIRTLSLPRWALGD